MKAKTRHNEEVTETLIKIIADHSACNGGIQGLRTSAIRIFYERYITLRTSLPAREAMNACTTFPSEEAFSVWVDKKNKSGWALTNAQITRLLRKVPEQVGRYVGMHGAIWYIASPASCKLPKAGRKRRSKKIAA